MVEMLTAVRDFLNLPNMPALGYKICFVPVSDQKRGFVRPTRDENAFSGFDLGCKLCNLKSLMKIDNPYLAYRYFFKMSELEVEEFWVLALSANLEYLGKKMLFRGSTSSCPSHPSEIFRFAIEMQAQFIIVAHNHPHGPLLPSQDDIQCTKRLVAAGQLLGIGLMDHMIVAQGKFISLRSQKPEIFHEASEVNPLSFERL
jgi:hypothetical protein